MRRPVKSTNQNFIAFCIDRNGRIADIETAPDLSDLDGYDHIIEVVSPARSDTRKVIRIVIE